MPPTSWSACAEVLTWWRRRGRTTLPCTHIPHIQHSISPLPHSFTPLFVRRDSVATVSPKHGNRKGLQTYIYIYLYKFVVSFLKIHQLGGSDTLWGVEIAKKHISQLMVADFLQVLRFNPDLDHQRRGWHTTDIKCYETFRAIWHRIYETFTTWNLWDTCRNSISTSVLNCSFVTSFDTIWGHLLGHPIIQHKTQKYLKTYRLI